MNSTKLISLIASSFFISPLFAQTDVRESLIKDWYSHEVANPYSDDFFPTKNPEVLTFKADDSLLIFVNDSRMGEMEYKATWELEDDSLLSFKLELNGQTMTEELSIRELTDSL